MAAPSARPARAVAALALLVAWGPQAAADGWPVGVARGAITPAEPMWMSGYGRRDHPAEGTLHDLHVKAIAFGEPALVLVTLDLLAIDHATAASIRGRLRVEHGLADERVAINCSHTHCGPLVGDSLPAVALLGPDDRAAVERYTARLVDAVVDCVGRALAARRPARASWGSGRCDVAVNRRENQETEVPALRAAGTPLRGPVDHDVPVLAFHDSDGTLIAAVFGYACHATVLDFYRWCGDYPGFACLEFERRHPGVTAVFWAGCGGDQNPLPRRSVELAEAYGRRLADAVDAVLAGGGLAPLEGPPAAAIATIDLPFAVIPDRAAWAAAAASDDRFEQARGRAMLARIERDGRVPERYRHYPVQAWRLGPGGPLWILLGGEVVVDYALRMKRELGPGAVWVAGYTNDVMAYVPSERVLEEGGYEGGGSMLYYGLPAPWAAGVEERIVAAVRGLVPPAPKVGQPAPPPTSDHELQLDAAAGGWIQLRLDVPDASPVEVVVDVCAGEEPVARIKGDARPEKDGSIVQRWAAAWGQPSWRLWRREVPAAATRLLTFRLDPARRRYAAWVDRTPLGLDLPLLGGGAGMPGTLTLRIVGAGSADGPVVAGVASGMTPPEGFADPAFHPAPEPGLLWRFAALGDPQIGFGGHDADVARLELAVRQINESNARFTLVLGDFIHALDDEQAFVDCLAAIRGLAGPWFPVRGNHDTKAMYARHVARPLIHSESVGGLRFVGLDAEGGESGLDDAQIGEIERHLAAGAAAGEELVVCSHVTPWQDHAKAGPYNKIGPGRDRLVELLTRYDVRLYFGGHLHRGPWTKEVDGIRYVILGGTALVKAGSVGWGVCDVYPDRIVIHHKPLFFEFQKDGDEAMFQTTYNMWTPFAEVRERFPDTQHGPVTVRRARPAR